MGHVRTRLRRTCRLLHLPGRPTSVAGIRLPDSAAAAAANRLCRAVSTDVLYAHAARSFVFAALLADREGVRLDEEALYVGCILHDLGLTDTYRHPTTPFEYVSADIARELTAEQG